MEGKRKYPEYIPKIPRKLLAIEPGALKSAYVIMVGYHPAGSGCIRNEELYEMIKQIKGKFTILLELLPLAGIAFGNTIFRTCIWIGKFDAAATDRNFPVYYIGKTEVNRHFLGRTDVAERTIRRILIKRFATHDKKTAHGTKENPDYLYHLTWGAMTAFSYGVAFLDKKLESIKNQSSASIFNDENAQEGQPYGISYPPKR